MSEKRDSSSFPHEEPKKKMKLDLSLSSGSDSYAKEERYGSEEGATGPTASAMENKPSESDTYATQEGDGSGEGATYPPASAMENKPSELDTYATQEGDGSEEGATYPPANTTESKPSGSDSYAKQEGDGLEEGATDPPASAMENKPRNPDDTESSSEPDPASGSSPLSGESTNTLFVYKKRTLVYKKSLTEDDVSKCRLMIPIQYGRKFLPEPEEHDGIYEDIKISFLDHKRQIWPMEASFDEPSSSYMLWLNWDRYLKKFNLKPEDTILIYHDPTIPTYDHYLIEYEKKARDANAKVIT